LEPGFGKFMMEECTGIEMGWVAAGPLICSFAQTRSGTGKEAKRAAVGTRRL
jgi:hypothetical protein